MRSIMPPRGTTRIRRRFLWWPLTIKCETRWLEFAWIKERVWIGVTLFGEYVWQPCAFVDGPEEAEGTISRQQHNRLTWEIEYPPVQPRREFVEWGLMAVVRDAAMKEDREIMGVDK